MKKSTWIILIAVLLIVGIVYLWSNKVGESSQPLPADSEEGNVDPTASPRSATTGVQYFSGESKTRRSTPVVLHGDKSSCLDAYEKAISDYHRFGFTTEPFTGGEGIRGEIATWQGGFSGQVTFATPSGQSAAVFAQSGLALFLTDTDKTFSIGFGGADEIGNLLHIIRPSDYAKEWSGLQENMDNVDYFDAHELSFFQTYISQPTSGESVSSCLVREENETCKYMYVGSKQSTKNTEYSLSCYMPSSTTMYAVISNAIKLNTTSEIPYWPSQQEIDDATIRLMNHIRVAK